MLSVLRFTNLAIVSSLEFELQPGLNVITGETGAGKSIVLKAVELLRGKKVGEDIIRTGAESAEVEGLFVLREAQLEYLRSNFSELEEVTEELIVRRVIKRSGRSRAYINGQLSTLSALEHLGPYLIDVTAQHYQQKILNADVQRDLLDSYGVASELNQAVRESYSLHRDAAKNLESYLKDQQQHTELVQTLEREYEEFKAAGVASGEREALDQQFQKLANVESISEHLGAAQELLESRLVSDLQALIKHLSEAEALGASTEEARKLAADASVQLEEAKLGVLDELGSLEVDPIELESVRERISELARLERRYSKSGDELVQYAESVKQKLESLQGGALDEKQLREKEAEALKLLKESEARLTSSRREVAGMLSTAVESGISELGMQKARFQIKISESSSSAKGADAIEFQLAANPGEDFKPIAKVASGGELSRVVLVLKALLNQTQKPLLQVFDEIDVGVSGAIAESIGEKLLAVSSDAQVLCVTHSAPVAACANSHFRLIKTTRRESTEVAMMSLADEERVGEIARMLAGKRVSAQFEASARELLLAR